MLALLFKIIVDNMSSVPALYMADPENALLSLNSVLDISPEPAQ